MATKYHIVKRGDLPTPICKKYGISLSQLVKLNHLKKNRYGNYLIYVGQKLIISGKSTSPSKPGKPGKKPNSNAPKIEHFGLQSDTDRTIFATWEWSKSHTDHYTAKWYYATGDGVWFVGSSSDVKDKQSTYNAPSNATKVKFKVKPVSKKHKVNKKEVSYWTADYSTSKIYNFADAPPSVPAVPTVTIDEYKLTAEINNIEDKVTEIEFNIVKDNSKTFKTGKAKVTKNHASYSCAISAGSEYKVRARAWKGKISSDWSDYSENKETAPNKPAKIIYVKALSSTAVQIKWEKVSNATGCEVEYTENEIYFDSSNEVKSISVNSKEYAEITGLESGKKYYFRVRAVNQQGKSSWSEIVSISIGEQPAAPTTWSSTTTAIIGEDVILYWVHNSEDGSAQVQAELELNINGTITTETISPESGGASTGTSTGTSDSDDVNKIHMYTFKSNTMIDGAEVKWKVRTMGITREYGDWSSTRTFNVYAPATLELEVTAKDGNALSLLEEFPFYVRALGGPSSQVPIGYHVSVIANESYETEDQIGNVKMVSEGDEIYSQYYDLMGELVLEISANSIDLENNVSYTLVCTVSMDTGLTAEDSVEFNVAWVEPEYVPNAEIAYDPETYTAHIRPYCEMYPWVYYQVNFDAATGTYNRTSTVLSPLEGTSVDNAFTPEGDIVYSNNSIYFCVVESENPTLVEGITLSVYRREYDGSFVEIGTGIVNTKNTFITDPHPSLDFARYRVVAIDDATGAVSFTDLPGYVIGEKAVIIQWDEKWSEFDTTNEDEMETPPWSGSLLRLPYNIDVSDSNKPDVTLVEYIGRNHPVSYYGTQLGTSSSWSVEIDKNDIDTLYALRRLARWMGDVYVREPSGSGYWANINVSFSQTHCELIIPVKLDINRVVGGV